jgi:uncharacterized membrane protein
MAGHRLWLTSLFAYLSLLVLSIAWEGWLAPAERVPPGFWLTLKSVPLLLPLFGLLHGRVKANIWAELLVMLYFMEGVIVAYLHRQDDWSVRSPLPHAWMEIILSLIFIVSSAYYVRNRNLRRAAA